MVKHQVTPAQAKAVRLYLESIGVSISHTQALEVLARGAGLRSRHHLVSYVKPSPAEASASNVERIRTRVSFSYRDGSGSDRSSCMSFRGRLTVAQLQFIAGCLDEEEYFVPGQVGFESLHFAFTDNGGDDHMWHSLQLGDSKDWVTDSDGFIVKAGDIEQYVATPDEPYPSADCGNLFWRFARLTKWNPDLQLEIVKAGVLELPLCGSFETAGTGLKAGEVVQGWAAATVAADQSELRFVVAQFLLDEGFGPSENPLVLYRKVATAAYQYCILEVQPDGSDAFQTHVRTGRGTVLPQQSLTHTTGQRKEVVVGKLRNGIDEQLQALWTAADAFAPARLS